jgi:Protein of unknown function (DUF2911)
MTMMKKAAALAVVALVASWSFSADAQWKRKKKTPDASQGAVVSQVIGSNNLVTITYHRPGVKGRDVWTGKSDNPQIGALVPRDGKPRPWRAGANEATTFETQEDVLINGEPLPAGKYGLYMIPSDGDWTVIFNKGTGWGSFQYKAEQDVLRVKVKSQEAPHQEWLVYGFDDPGASSATAYLRWEKVKVPFTVSMKEK